MEEKELTGKNSETNEKNNRIKKADIILIAAALMIGIIGLIIYSVTRTKGLSVNLYQDGKIVKTFSLDKDAEFDYESDLGKNTIVIKDGKASCIWADCPDKLCVKMSDIENDGETIICLPHKLVIEVTDSDS